MRPSDEGGCIPAELGLRAAQDRFAAFCSAEVEPGSGTAELGTVCDICGSLGSMSSGEIFNARGWSGLFIVCRVKDCTFDFPEGFGMSNQLDVCDSSRKVVQEDGV